VTEVQRKYLTLPREVEEGFTKELAFVLGLSE
jgi:hypothetical protein